MNAWGDPWGLKEYITFPMESLHPEAQGTYFIQATGYHYTDKVALYKEAGLAESFDSSKWISHYVSYDSNTGMMEMQLASLEAHEQSHIGGVHDFETHYGIKYNTEEAGKVANSYH